jgi:hypothetical protein
MASEEAGDTMTVKRKRWNVKRKSEVEMPVLFPCILPVTFHVSRPTEVL